MGYNDYIIINRKNDMDKKRIFVALIMAIALIMLASCSKNAPSDSTNDKVDITPPQDEPDEPSEPEPEPEPQPYTVYLDNRAGWEMVCCRFYDENDEYLCEKEASCDTYGVYYITIPVECAKYLFTDKAGNFTPLLTEPEGENDVFNNESDQWTRYSDAIKNTLSLGKNSIAITPELKEAGREYIEFSVEKEGIYTLNCEYGVEAAFVTVEIGKGNWDKDSADWTSFSTPLDSAVLTPGSYYICIFYDYSLADGVYSVELSYEISEPEPKPLLNRVFTDGEYWFYFYEVDGSLMGVRDMNGASCDYTYTTYAEKGITYIRLIPLGDDDYVFNNSYLSALSSAKKIFVIGDILTVKGREFAEVSQNEQNVYTE
jgi:hypothetical protein